MSNKQVIAIFIIGVVLLLGAFWAGLYVVKQQDSTSNANQNRAANQNARNASSANQNSTSQASANTNTQPSQPSSDARYIVQVGSSFGTVDKANELTSQLRHKYPSAHTQNPTGTDTLYRVRIGPYNNREDAQQVANELASQGFKGVMIFPWSGN
jgi:cell division septation protein DedD